MILKISYNQQKALIDYDGYNTLSPPQVVASDAYHWWPSYSSLPHG